MLPFNLLPELQLSVISISKLASDDAINKEKNKRIFILKFYLKRYLLAF